MGGRKKNKIKPNKTHQRADGGGLSGTAVTHDHDTTDVGVDDVHDSGELHLLLSDDGAERVHGPGGGVGGLLGGGCRRERIGRKGGERGKERKSA